MTLFFLLTEKLETSPTPINLPFRSYYYGVGTCLEGTAQLKANVESYTIVPNSIVVKLVEGVIPQKYDEILGLYEKGISPIVITCIGTRHQEDLFQHFKKS